MGIMQGKRQTITSGEMRQKAQFLNNVPTQNASGGNVDNYTAFYTCRCRLLQKSGMKRLEQAETVNTRKFEMVCRFTLNLEGQITASTRVQITLGTVTDNYAIDTYELVDSLNHWYNFTLSKINS